MGALNSNIRNRDGDYSKSLASVSPPFDQSYGQISKRRKLSDLSILSRISLYPDSKPRFFREVQAPVRRLRFGSKSRTKRSEGGASFFGRLAEEMGNCLGIRFPYSNCLEFLGKGKEKVVIEIDDDGDKEKLGDVSDDSSFEEIGNIDFSRSNRKKGYRGVSLQEHRLEIVDKDLRFLDSSVFTDVSNNVNAFGVPAHENLYHLAKRRDDKLSTINLEIEYNKKRLQRLRLFQSPEKYEQVKKIAVDECFVCLTQEEHALVACALSNSNRRRVLVSHENSNIDITGEKMQCLRPGSWLNDDVINLYLALLKEREQRDPQNFLKCHFFNTFFYKKLISGVDGYNFQAVRRWTTGRKLGYNLVDCDKIFVPIHKVAHWCLAIINKKDKKFQYLDSLGGVDNRVMSVLARYYVDEVKDKTGKDIDVSSWVEEFVTNLPHQENGFDCGMFMIKYIDFYSKDIGLCFYQARTHAIFSGTNNKGDFEFESRMMDGEITRFFAPLHAFLIVETPRNRYESSKHFEVGFS
ncbi:hypothetical protein OROGR_015603 [Orobanche gracilis]